MTDTCIGCGRYGDYGNIRIKALGLEHYERLCGDCADLLILNRCDLIAAIKEIIR